MVDVRGSGISVFLATWQRNILKGGRRPGRRYEQLGAGLGFSPAPLPVAWTAPDDDAKAAALLGDGPVIGLGPTANWAGKSGRRSALLRCIRRWRRKSPARGWRYLPGPGAQERALAAPVLAALPGAIDLVGSLTLAEVAACLRRCAIFVGNDFGLMHIAAAAGTPTLGLFWPLARR